jgi:CCR4-NOT transcription complex subunit 4
MPLPSLHPLPVNPTTGQQPMQPISARGSGGGPSGGVPPASAAGGGGVNKETLKGLQDVVWSDDEVGFLVALMTDRTRRDTRIFRRRL